MIIYNRTEYKTLSPKQYKKEKKRLQVELLKLQEWVIKNNKRIGIVFEGRDAAGKGSTIKRFIENMMPKTVKVIELGVPSKRQERNWFNTWKKRTPLPLNSSSKSKAKRPKIAVMMNCQISQMNLCI